MTVVCFMDTETLGLHPMAPVWEFAAIRRDLDTGAEEEFHAFFNHDTIGPHGSWLDELPDEFRDDYYQRYDDKAALRDGERAAMVWAATRGAHIIGAVPNFDTERLTKLLNVYKMSRPWHYHLIDVENVVVGYLTASQGPVSPPWSSDMLSLSIGVRPDEFARHTAMGDVLWIRAQWDAVMANA